MRTQNIDLGRNKRKFQEECEDSNPLDEDLIRVIDDEVSNVNVSRQEPSTQKGKHIGHLGDYFMPRTTPGAQPTLRSAVQSKEVIEKCDIAIAKWMFDAPVPFNAVNLAYYQPMIDAICSMGPGYKAPNMQRVRGFLLSKWVDEVKKLVESYRNVWKQTGCTLMADGWTDRCGRTFINFLVYCPKGTNFLKSVDASQHSRIPELLYMLFKEVVLFVGAENVVHIVTDNAPNYVAAGRLLEAEFPKLFWSPCATHCVKLMLQDIGKLEDVSETMQQASKITKYIYNHCYALYLMRKHTCGGGILRSAHTSFATNFIALQSILAKKDSLRVMVTSMEWKSSTYAKDARAKIFVEQVLDYGFWKKCVDIVELTEPLVRLLHLVSEDKPAMGFIYQAFYKAREEMVKRFQTNKKKVEPYLNIIDGHWDSRLCKNLNAAGYWLNPACRFNLEDYEKHKITITGLYDGLKNQLWESYGSNAPHLQKLAIRVLSQTCSVSGCYRNWSVFEHIHSIKRNRLERQKLIDLVFVRYNLRLQQRSRLKRQSYDPINFETIDDHSDWVLEESPPFLTNEEVDALHNDLANITIQPISDDIDQLNLDDDAAA
ncbi:uncharacterized protein LOC130722998 [Lotus japonicus]|uniref:uncharacterized protein LOC130722998 n=1 Tax=Lotus japonicus TaxID=34305 RepID=UPI002591058E|nr:uncharacterized protein LOC130722998 [Lotus japonicus]